MESISKVTVKLLFTHFLLLVGLATTSQAIVKNYDWCYTFASGESVIGSILGEAGGSWDEYQYPGATWAKPGDSGYITVFSVNFALYLADGTFASSSHADDGLLEPGVFAPQTVPKNGSKGGLDVSFAKDTDQGPTIIFYCSPYGTGVQLWDWTYDEWGNPTDMQLWSVQEEGNAGWKLLNPERIPETGFTLTLLAVAIAAVAIGHRRRMK